MQPNTASKSIFKYISETAIADYFAKAKTCQ